MPKKASPRDKKTKMDLTANEEEWDDSLLCKAYTKALKRAEEIIRDTPAEHIPDININECAASVDWTWKRVENKPRAWRVGMRCRAIFSGDGREYEAIVDSIQGSVADVKFEGYNNMEEVELATLQPSLGQQAIEEQQYDAHMESIYIFEYERSLPSYLRRMVIPRESRSPSPPRFNPQEISLSSDDDCPGVLYNRRGGSVSSDDYIHVPNPPERCNGNISYSTSDEENEFNKLDQRGNPQPPRYFQARPQNTAQNVEPKYFKANSHKEPASSRVPPNFQSQKSMEPLSVQGPPQGQQKLYIEAFTRTPTPRGLSRFYIPSFKGLNSQGEEERYINATTVPGPSNPQGKPQYFLEASSILGPPNPHQQQGQEFLNIYQKDETNHAQSKPEGHKNPEQKKGLGNSNEQNKPDIRIHNVLKEQNNYQRLNNFIGPGYFKPPTSTTGNVGPKSTLPSGTQEQSSYSQGQSQSYPRTRNPQIQNGQGQKYPQPQGPQVQRYPPLQGYPQGQGYPQPQGYSQGQGYPQAPVYYQGQGYSQTQGYSQGQGYPRSYPQGSSYSNFQGYPLSHSQRQAPTYNSSQQYVYSAEPLSQQQRAFAVLQQCLGPMTLAAPANSAVVGPIHLPAPLNNTAPIPTYVASAPVNVVPAPANIAPGQMNFAAPLNNTAPIPTYVASAPVNVASAPANIAPGSINFAAPLNNTAPIPTYVASAPVNVASAPANIAPGPMNFAAPLNNTVPIPTYVASAPVNVASAPANIAPGPMNFAAPLNNTAPIPTYVASAQVNVAPAPANIPSRPISFATTWNNIPPIPTHVASAPVNFAPGPANIAPGPISFVAPLNNTAPISTNVAPAPANIVSGPFSFSAPVHNTAPIPYVAPVSVAPASANIASRHFNFAAPLNNTAPVPPYVKPNFTSGTISCAGAQSNRNTAKPEPFKFTARPTNVATVKSQTPVLPGPISTAPDSPAAAQVKPLPPKLPVREKKTDESRRFEMPPMPNMEELMSNVAPPAPPLPFPLAEVLSESDRIQSSMLLSWYSSGYYTGLYQAMIKKSKNEEQPAETQ